MPRPPQLFWHLATNNAVHSFETWLVNAPIPVGFSRSYRRRQNAPILGMNFKRNVKSAFIYEIVNGKLPHITMELICFKCGTEFQEIKSIFKHLRNEHGLKNNVEKLKCLVKNVGCSKAFLNFDSLRQHIKTCSQMQCAPNVDELAFGPTILEVLYTTYKSCLLQTF